MSAALDLSGLMSDPDFAQTFTRKPRTMALANEGLATTTMGTSVSLLGVIEPAKQADLLILPEGTRLVDLVAISTAGDVQIGGQASTADLLVVDGVTYKALHVEDFRDLAGYIRVLAQRIPT